MSDQTPRDDAAMADILASIRRIVTEENGAGRPARALDDDVLELTPSMRVDGGGASQAPRADLARSGEPDAATRPPAAPRASAAETPPAGAPAETPQAGAPSARPGEAAAQPAATVRPPQELSIDEAAVADIARAVMREEFSGAFGRSLTQQIRQLISAEVSRALAAQRRADESRESRQD